MTIIPSSEVCRSLLQAAVIGRSNVGKSTLINALLYGKAIARTSAKPVSLLARTFGFSTVDSLLAVLLR